MIIQLYKSSKWCYQHHLRHFGKLFDNLIKLTCAADVSGKTRIGKNVSFSHFGTGLIIHPEAIIGDVNVLKDAPMDMIKSGYGDILGKYSCLNDWKLSKERGKSGCDDFAYMLSKMALNNIMFNDLKDLTSFDFINQLTQSLVMGGLAMEIAGSSRPSSGSEHLFCHALEENYSEQTSVPHGIAVAIGSYGACKMQKRNLRKIKKVIKAYEIPVKPSDWKITKEIFIGAWQDAAATRPDRYTILNETDLSDEFLGELYDEMEKEFA